MTEYSKIIKVLDAASSGQLSDVSCQCQEGMCYVHSIDISDATGKTALWIAIERGNGVAVEALMKAGANVNRTYGSRRTPLMFAVQKGHAEYIPAMLEAGAGINSLDSFGMSALMIACQKGFLDCLQVLITAGASLHFRDIRGKTALMIALEEDSCDCLNYLIEAGADIHIIDFQGFSPLMITVCKNCETCFHSLIQAGVFVDTIYKDGKTALIVAIERESMILPLLIQSGANIDLNVRGKTPVMIAAGAGRVNSLLLLVQAGADLNETDELGQTALMMASEAGHKQCLECLINGGAKQDLQDAKGRSAMMLAAYKGHHVCLQVLVGQRWKDVHCREGKTALIYAVEAVSEFNASKCLQILLEAGANPGICDTAGRSPLMHAARIDTLAKLFQQLIDAGADINVANKSNMTALGHAASHGNFEYVRKLVDLGASVNTVSSTGVTPLIHLAMRPVSLSLGTTISYLLNHGAEVNAQDSSGMTALMWAAKSSASMTVMSLLISHGAKIDMKDKLGFSAFYHTLRYDEDCVINATFLLDNGANPNHIAANGQSSLSLVIRSRNYNLLVLLLKSIAELRISYEDFRQLVVFNSRRMLQLLVSNGAMPSVNDQYSFEFYEGWSILMITLCHGSLAIAKFLLAIGYLNKFDVIGRKHFLRQNMLRLDLQCVSFLENVHSQPWPLVRLCFVAVSSLMGSSPGRKEKVKNSGLPDRIQRMLLFQEPITRLCKSQWETIPFCFDPNDYENLPMPHPLLFNWPFGRNLTPCDCKECFQTGFKFI